MRLATLLALTLPLLASDGQTVLDRISRRVGANVRNMPRYTCEEAIERRWYSGNALERSDRIRLDVAVGATGEMFAWHGDRGFQSGAVDELIKSGPISSGTFSSFLANIFAPGKAQMKYTGEGNFTYSMPLNRSSFLIGTGAGKALTAYEGSFSADPFSGKLTKLQIRSDTLPKEAFMTSLDMQVSYAETRLGEADVELPTTVTMDVTDLKHDRTRSVTTYRNCHQFLGESIIHFDDDPASEQSANTPAAPFAMPPRREMAVRLLTGLQPATAWAGDRIEGVLLTNIAGTAPKGTKVLGHLLRAEIVEGRRPIYNIDLIFDELVLGGATHPIHLESVSSPTQFQRDRLQVAVSDGDATACRFRLTYKNENLRNAITYWKSSAGSPPACCP